MEVSQSALSYIIEGSCRDQYRDHFPGGNQGLRAVEVSLQEAVGYRAYEDITAGEYVPDLRVPPLTAGR